MSQKWRQLRRIDAYTFFLADVNHDGHVDLINLYVDDTSTTVEAVVYGKVPGGA